MTGNAELPAWIMLSGAIVAHFHQWCSTQSSTESGCEQILWSGALVPFPSLRFGETGSQLGQLSTLERATDKSSLTKASGWKWKSLPCRCNRPGTPDILLRVRVTPLSLGKMRSCRGYVRQRPRRARLHCEKMEWLQDSGSIPVSVLYLLKNAR